MSEMAIRLADGQKVKIGTCCDLFALRWDQREQVTDFPGTMNNRRWRLPIPDEDYVLPGDFDFSTWRSSYYTCLHGMLDDIKDDPVFLEHPGIVQTRIDSLGILVNVKCYHGLRLPTDSEDFTTFFNGRTFPLRLKAVENNVDADEMLIIVGCVACNHTWTCTFNEIEKYIVSLEMRLRLFKICQEYWEERHEDWDVSGYAMADILPANHELVLACGQDCWVVYLDGRCKANGDFDECSSVYKAILKSATKEFAE